MPGIPVAQLRGSSICIYDERITMGYSKLNYRSCNMVRTRATRYAGRMTAGAKKRMVRAISLMVQNTKPKWIENPVTGRLQLHRMTFITLTVADQENISARDAYDKLLSHFLQWLRRTKGVKTYIWKAELQKRGQIHYHITCPDFIHYEEIRAKWNDLQHQAGFLKSYAAVHGHCDPNSTDVHEVRETKKMDFYLVKELAKTIEGKRLYNKKVVESLIKAGELPEEKKDFFVNEYTGTEICTEGKVWDCSENLSAFGLFNTELMSHHEERLAQWVLNGQCREVRGDFWTMYYFNGPSPPEVLAPAELLLFNDHISQINRYEAKRNRKQLTEN